MASSGRVITHNSDRFEVETNGEVKLARARGKLKRDGEILVGDFVSLDEASEETVITAVSPRRNSLIRPAVANVDVIVLVLAPSPAPDMELADKLVINCKQAGIDVAICLNKRDEGGMTREDVERQYGSDVTAVVTTCAVRGEVDELKSALVGKLACFAGQSGVGKSTIVNALTGGGDRKTGGLSEKIMRGKNTTTAARILKTDFGGLVVDTPGFSTLDAFEEDYRNLAAYYDDYVALADGCKFHPCTHTTEPDCEVKRAVASGRLDEDRYERYLTIFEQAKRAYKNYGRTKK